MDKEIAAVLNREGFLSARGRAFKAENVWLLRTRWGIPTVKINGASANPMRWPDGSFSVQGAAAALGIAPQTVFDYLGRGLLTPHVSSFAQHAIARDWLDQQLNGSGSIGLPWASVLAFLRLVTNPRVFEHPEPIGDTWRQVGAWPACEMVWIPQPTERHAELLGEFLSLPDMHGNLVPDAHLAALAVEHGLTLCSTDGDFARFRPLRWLNPIIP
jgi:toxin-antitoxin system PIN domain toxin